MKTFEGKRVLVLDGDSRQILPILHGLSQLKCDITTVSNTELDNGYVSRYPNRRLLDNSTDLEALYEHLLSELKTGEYDVLLVLSDALMNLTTQHKEEICQYVRFPFADRETFLKAYNKQITMETCMLEKIPCPITKKDSESLESFLDHVTFPIVAKPRMACGSMGLKIVTSREQLDAMLGSGKINMESYVIQEFIPQTGKQVNVHLFMDSASKLKSSVVTEKTRWYPVDGGASCLCRTIHNDAVLQDCVKLLKRIGWSSYCEIELIEDPRDGLFKIMEINGRASASIKIMELAGINAAEQMMDFAYGEPIRVYADYQDDIRMRRLSADVLWFMQSPGRLSKKPSWFSLRRTHEVTFSIRDPMPFFATGVKLLLELGAYRAEMQKRKRI